MVDSSSGGCYIHQSNGEESRAVNRTHNAMEWCMPQTKPNPPTILVLSFPKVDLYANDAFN